MSDLDEPPAKVLKIDTIDGVTQVTELSEYPVPFDGGEEVMCEESGIIEGGADPPEEQEQWLSEGILTDDDYMPNSQETAEDRTDSQLDEEEHLDSTLDSEHLEQNEHHVVENQQELEQNEQHSFENQQNIVSNGHDMVENEQNLPDDQQDLVNKHNLDENDQHLLNNEAQNDHDLGSNEEHLVINEQSLGNEQNFDENEQHYENEEHLADTSIESESANVEESEQNQMEVDATPSLDNSAENGEEMNQKDESQTIEKLMEMSNLDSNIESQTYTQEYDDNTQAVESRPKEKEKASEPVEMNIEEAMKNLDAYTDVRSDDFSSLMKRNTDDKGAKPKSEANDNDDGNDTDDLLRMLGEGDSKSKKKLSKTVKDIRNAARAADSTDDDDDFVYESTRIKKIKAAQSVLKNKIPTKAVPEDLDDVEQTQPAKNQPINFKYGASILRHNRNRPVVNIIERPKTVKPRQYYNKNIGQSLLKPTSKAANADAPTTAPSSLNNQEKMTFKPAESKTSTPFKASLAQQSVERKTYAAKSNDAGKLQHGSAKISEAKKPDMGKLKYEPSKMKPSAGIMRVLPELPGEQGECPSDGDFPLDEDEFAESDNDISHRQRIMRPEMMDEEIPSDGESGDEDASLYDEMPTSDSDDADDWFQLDLRCEKATDYLPLLGPKAKELLLEEKRRVSARLATLSQSHAALAASGRHQAALLRRATAALAEIDDIIRAA